MYHIHTHPTPPFASHKALKFMVAAYSLVSLKNEWMAAKHFQPRSPSQHLSNETFLLNSSYRPIYLQRMHFSLSANKLRKILGYAIEQTLHLCSVSARLGLLTAVLNIWSCCAIRPLVHLDQCYLLRLAVLLQGLNPRSKMLGTKPGSFSIQHLCSTLGYGPPPLLPCVNQADDLDYTNHAPV